MQFQVRLTYVHKRKYLVRFKNKTKHLAQLLYHTAMLYGKKFSIVMCIVYWII